jgi:hypothetical protein
MPTAPRRPSPKASSFMSVPEYKDRKARRAFCHLDAAIRPEFSTLKGFAATIKHLDGFFYFFVEPAASVASVHASNTTHGDDGTNVPRPKPQRGMEEGHSSHGAKHNGPRPTPKSREASNSRGRAGLVPFPPSALAAQSERTHGPRMKSVSAGEVRQLKSLANEQLI